MNLEINNLPEHQQAASKLTRSDEIFLDENKMESINNYVSNKFSKTYRTKPNESQYHDTFYHLDESKSNYPDLKKRNPTRLTNTDKILPQPDEQIINELRLEDPIKTTQNYNTFPKDQIQGSVS
jgi:hypothetical protein